MNPANPPFSHGSLNAARAGFWDQRKKSGTTRADKWTKDSPLWRAYHWGYRVAEENPDGQWAWCYTQDRLQVRAVEIALSTTSNIESRREKLGDARVNEVLALREGWKILLEALHHHSIKLEQKRQRYNSKRRREKANGKAAHS